MSKFPTSDQERTFSSLSDRFPAKISIEKRQSDEAAVVIGYEKNTVMDMLLPVYSCVVDPDGLERPAVIERVCPSEIAA